MTQRPNDDDHLELAYASFAVLADDGRIDIGELNFVLGLALRDGTIDEQEKDVLRNLFNRVLEGDVSGEVWKRIQHARRRHGI